MNQIEERQYPLTVRKYNEHRATSCALASLSHGSVYEGHKNDRVFKNIHKIINDLIDREYFDPDCYLGRMPFAGIESLRRAAVYVKPSRIHAMRDNITMYALNHKYDPEELLRVLYFCSINAASNGVFEFESVTCQNAFKILRALPVSVRSGVLQGRYKTVKLFSAV